MGQPFLVNGTGRYYVEKLYDSMIYSSVVETCWNHGFLLQDTSGGSGKVALKAWDPMVAECCSYQNLEG